MYGPVNFKYKRLPSIDQIKDALSLHTGLNIDVKEHQLPVYTDDELEQFGLSNEKLDKVKEDSISCYLKVDEPTLSCLISLRISKKEINLPWINYHKKCYFDGALLLILKALGGITSEELSTLVADYSYTKYEIGRKNPNFIC